MISQVSRLASSAVKAALVTGIVVVGVALMPAHASVPSSIVQVAQADQAAAPAAPAPAADAAAPAQGAEPPKMTQARFNVVAMIANADIVVQAVMLFLGLCSVATWVIFIEKSILLRSVSSLSKRFLTAFRGGRTIDEISKRTASVGGSPVSRMWDASKQEWDLFQQTHRGHTVTVHQADQLLQRMIVASSIVQEGEMQRLSASMGILATIGSTSPFIGLFGTVWGILNSFIGIAASRATSLAVVAPGIAEALLATAIGLFAAIPAVMIYNKFARQISQVTGTLDNFQAELSTIVSRELEVVG